MDGTPDDVVDPGVALVRELASESRTVDAMLREHEEDNDEVLPTIFLGDVATWFERACVERDDEPEVFAEAKRVAGLLGHHFEHGSSQEQNVIAVGFVEVLPGPGALHRDCANELPLSLRSELDRMERWSPSKSVTAKDAEAEEKSGRKEVYYARLAPGRSRENPSGVIRRRREGDHTVDEAFTRDLRWVPTDYFERVRIGRTDDDYVEITEVEAEAFIRRIREQLG